MITEQRRFTSSRINAYEVPVDVIGMDLVEDDHLAGESEAADKEVFHANDTLQRSGQSCPRRKARGEPAWPRQTTSGLVGRFRQIIAVFLLASLERWLPEIKVVLQPRVAVNQAQGASSARVLRKALDPLVNPVARHLRGSAK